MGCGRSILGRNQGPGQRVKAGDGESDRVWLQGLLTTGGGTELAIGWKRVLEGILSGGRMAWCKGGKGVCKKIQHEAMGDTGFSSGMVGKGCSGHEVRPTVRKQDVGKPFASIIRW